MKHYNRIFNILYTICLCLTVTALARPLLSYKSVRTTSPAVKSNPGNDSAEIKRVALTFDDGPHPVYTEKLLDALKERGVTATFFVTGEHAELHPDIIKRIHDEGHLIGNHTYSHIQLTSSNRDKFQRELVQTNEILYDITGDEVQYVRPPYGSWDKTIETELNMFPVLWNIDPLDWCTANASRVANTVLKKVSDNDIILLHDYYDTSVDAAIMVVDALQKQGYDFVTVDKILFD
ncbi:MAG: polysaccharide deacetylase family protein [Lachnospiraceae bacterium]|nr:polysaccharide deacetylase family protein [Lachnospiraceae bacterium]